jgi:hypothetical protein
MTISYILLSLGVFFLFGFTNCTMGYLSPQSTTVFSHINLGGLPKNVKRFPKTLARNCKKIVKKFCKSIGPKAGISKTCFRILLQIITAWLHASN